MIYKSKTIGVTPISLSTFLGRKIRMKSVIIQNSSILGSNSIYVGDKNNQLLDIPEQSTTNLGMVGLSQQRFFVSNSDDLWLKAGGADTTVTLIVEDS